MKRVKMISIALSVLGVALFAYGSYMASKAAFDQGRIAQAEAAGQRRPTLGPVRRIIRTRQAEAKQKMLSQAGQKVAVSQVTANWLRGIGAAFFVIGIGTLIFWRKKRI
jgi:hypothetical protein